MLEKVDARKKAIIAKKKAEDLKAAQVLHDKKLAEEAAAKQEANPGDLVDTNVQIKYNLACGMCDSIDA